MSCPVWLRRRFQSVLGGVGGGVAGAMVNATWFMCDVWGAFLTQSRCQATVIVLTRVARYILGEAVTERKPQASGKRHNIGRRCWGRSFGSNLSRRFLVVHQLAQLMVAHDTLPVFVHDVEQLSVRLLRWKQWWGSSSQKSSTRGQAGRRSEGGQ